MPYRKMGALHRKREREKREIIDLSLGRARVLIKVASLLLLKVEEIL